MRAPGRVAAVLVLAASVGCAPPVLQLPTGASTPLADSAAILHEAIGHCGGLHSVTAEIGLSGRVRSTKLRGRLQAGFATPSSLRLEAVAPFGAPFFILAGTAERSTLWLPRDARVLRDAAAPEIVEALAGFSAAPADLAAWIEGCPAATFDARDARAFGDRWAQIAAGDRTAWLRKSDRWRLVQTERAGLSVEFSGHVGTQPGRIRIRRDATAERGALDVGLSLGQVETNVALAPDAFAVDVRGETTPITLDELRQSGPLRDTSAGTH